MKPVVCSLFAAAWLITPQSSFAMPMRPLVRQPQCAWDRHPVDAEETSIKMTSRRYSVEVAHDEDLPVVLRKPEGPKAAPLLRIGF